MQQSMNNKWLPLAIVCLVIQNILLLVINVVSVIVGLFAVALGLFFLEDQLSVSDKRPIKNLPKWLWIFGNDADGVNGDKRLWWDKNCDSLVFVGLLLFLRSKGVKVPVITSESYIARWWWAAIRNPSNNLRFVSFTSCPVSNTYVNYFGDYKVKDKLGFEGWQVVVAKHKLANKYWFGFYWVVKYPGTTKGLRVRLGYKIEPEDNLSSNKLSVGFAISILPNKDLT